MSAHFHSQRGAVTLVGALFIIITLALMVQVLNRTAGSDMLDSAVQSDSVEAFFIAESGLEYAAAAYNTSTCDSGLATGTPIDVGRGSFTVENIGTEFTSDFSGALLPATDCRIQVTGSIPTLGVQRVVEAIFSKDGNLLGTANADFNEPKPPCAPCSPTGWNLPADGWEDDAGPDGTGDRAARVVKPTNGQMAVTIAGVFGLTPFTVTAPEVLTLEYDYKASGTGKGQSPKATYTFHVWDGTNLYSSAGVDTVYTDWTSGSVTIPITGSGPVTITEFRFSIEAKAGQVTTAWLDNLDLRGPGGGTGVSLLRWRERVTD
ncbi:MAG: pilus assembly PilX N-terminal domain-containing protein [Thiogranum sp.]|nr:pilus assembly PilX N-terminal domain-containing protein [Thiogranum sp.]